MQVGGNWKDKCSRCGEEYMPSVEFHTCAKVATLSSKKNTVFAKEQVLDVDFETARALHRVVRGMNDGECPKCHLLDRQKVYTDTVGNLCCSACGYEIPRPIVQAAIDAFAVVMNKNLEVFETWRQTLESASAVDTFPPRAEDDAVSK